MGKLAAAFLVSTALGSLPATAQQFTTLPIPTIPVSQLPAAGTLTGPELFYAIQGGVSKNVTFLALQQSFTRPIVSQTITSAGADVLTGILYSHKTTAFATPGGASSGIFASIYGQTDIGQGTWSNQAGVYGIVNNSNTQHSQPGSTASAVAVLGAGFCLVAGCSATWGGLAAGYDTSGQADPANPLYGLEVDNYAHGTDAGQERIGLQIVAGTPDGLGASNVVSHGLLFTGSGGTGGGQFTNLIDGATALAQNGIVLNSMTFTGFAWLSPGSAIDSAGNGSFFTVGSSVFTVAMLPSCPANAGNRAFVNDAMTAPVYNDPIPAGGGTNSGWVGCRNSTWVWD